MEQKVSSPGQDVKSDQLEIERKYVSKEHEWDDFVELCKSLKPSKQLKVSGPDTYYTDGKNILRWRLSNELSELTYKARYSTKSTLVRRELDVKVTGTPVRTVLKFLSSIGFKKMFRITKKCHIFWFNDPAGKVCAVVYKVAAKSQPDRYFVEIEAPKGLGVGESKALIREWEVKLNLKPHRRLNSSLFEIYSGTPTQMVEKTLKED